jgi:hypothetical protein
VTRLWETPAAAILNSGLSTPLLAPLAAVTPDRMPAVVHGIDEPLDRETSPNKAQELRSSYQAILTAGRAVGRAVEARAILLA